MINHLVLEVLSFGKKKPQDDRSSEEKTKDELKKLQYGKPYSTKDIIHQHMTGELLPALNVFMAKKVKRGRK